LNLNPLIFLPLFETVTPAAKQKCPAALHALMLRRAWSLLAQMFLVP
jgi:hypothetical protein